jgi:adenosylcobinamide-phosphate synthase
MTHLQILLLALVLDYFIGDPKVLWQRFPHPAVIMGRIVTWFDDHLNKGAALRVKGIVAVIIMSIVAIAFGLFIRWIPDFGIIELALVTVLLAHNSLVQHVRNVATALGNSLQDGRAAVARIVGRDTAELDVSNVARAGIESAAENFSDAVVAPVFWYLFFGPAGLIFYKMVNTADSMIGHRTPRYAEFGFGAAKLDDIINWIPARLCGALMCLVYRSQNSFEIMRTDANLHSSPNAGWPEAAMAAILDIALAGPRKYNGKLTEDSFINPRGRQELTADDITDAVGVLNRSWLGLTAIIAVLALFMWVMF